MASAVARAYNGGLGAEPPAGSRGSFFAFGRPVKAVKFDVLTVSVSQCVYT